MEIAYRSTEAAAGLDALGERLVCLADGGEDVVPQLVDAILDGAAASGASDIHIESQAAALAVRYRVDGQLLDVARLRKERAANVFARLKLLSRVVTYRKRSPQDGRLAAAEGAALRAAFMPTLHGEKAVLRLPNAAAPRQLEDIGLAPADLARLASALARPQGTMLFTGPCSSGKSTSIYAALRHLIGSSPLTPNIASLEDPIEQEIEGVNQTQIDPAGGLTFLSGLRTLLRMDPNVIFVGEVRDEETAATVIQAGLSGHLVISTIHGGSAAQVFARLLHMKIEPFLVASSVTAVVAQRLVRRLCPACRRRATDADAFEAAGCRECNGTGYAGRAAVFETGIPDEAVREAVLRSAPTAEIHALLCKAGMRPLAGAARDKAMTGETSLQEIARVVG